MIHGDDLQYLFGTETNEDSFTEDEKKTSQLMLTLWTDFAKTFQIESWPNYSSNKRSFLSIGPEPETKENLFAERMLLWKKLVWEPIIKSLKTKVINKKKQTPMMLSSILPYPFPSLIPSTWTLPYGHWRPPIYSHGHGHGYGHAHF